MSNYSWQSLVTPLFTQSETERVYTNRYMRFSYLSDGYDSIMHPSALCQTYWLGYSTFLDAYRPHGPLDRCFTRFEVGYSLRCFWDFFLLSRVGRAWDVRCTGTSHCLNCMSAVLLSVYPQPLSNKTPGHVSSCLYVTYVLYRTHVSAPRIYIGNCTFLKAAHPWKPAFSHHDTPYSATRISNKFYFYLCSYIIYHPIVRPRC